MLFDLFVGQLRADLVERFDRLDTFQPESGSNRITVEFAIHFRPTLSLTNGSSIAARFSSGERSTCPYSGPPTYSTKFPNSSLNAVNTSSSSSTESNAIPVRKRDRALGRGTWGRLTVKEWDKLVSRSLGTQGQGDGRKTVDCTQTKNNIIMLDKFISPFEFFFFFFFRWFFPRRIAVDE